MRRIAALLRENRSFLFLLLGFGLIRTAVADYNPVPSGSMHPTILEGDVVLVNRLAYGVKIPLTDTVITRLADPRRGDIVTFSSPQDGRRLIKRVIGIPGDVVAMRDKRLSINGVRVEYAATGLATEFGAGDAPRAALQLEESIDHRSHEIQWLAGAHTAADFGPVTVPADQYLMLGDNRDNSADSRFIGLVPRTLLIGRAERILVSASVLGNWLPRFDRFGQSLHPRDAAVTAAQPAAEPAPAVTPRAPAEPARK
jgi:signal peptidase I